MQFKVPQFIEMESKVFGPLTFKQAVYIGGAAGASYAILKFLPIILAIPLVLAVAAFGWALAFYPQQKFGKPFIEITEAAFRYIAKRRLYTWKRMPPEKKLSDTEEKESAESLLSVPKVPSGNILSLSKKLETGEDTEKE